MKKLPMIVVVIAMLDLLAAATSLLLIDDIGLIAAALQFVLYAGMALGLFALRRWARVIALMVSAVELAGLFAAIVFVLYVSPRLGSPTSSFGADFVVTLSALVVVNVLVIAALFLPSVKAQFR